MWNFVSPQAKDLVVKMTEIDPEKRISSWEALQHKWFTQEFKIPRSLAQAIANMKKAKYCLFLNKMMNRVIKAEKKFDESDLLTSSPLLTGGKEIVPDFKEIPVKKEEKCEMITKPPSTPEENKQHVQPAKKHNTVSGTIAQKLNSFIPGIGETRNLPITPGSAGGSRRKLESSDHIPIKGKPLGGIEKITESFKQKKGLPEKSKKASSLMQIPKGPTNTTDDPTPGESTPKAGWHFDATRVRNFSYSESKFKFDK